MIYFDQHFLFALPMLDGSYFERKVIYLNAHNELGALGVVINNPLSDLDIKEFVALNDINPIEGSEHLSVYSGGPVDTNAGFVLYEALTNEGDSNLAISNEKKFFQEILNGQSWQKNQIMLGRSSWSAGQLEAEIEHGAWWIMPSFPDLVFNVPYQQRWSVGMEQLGIRPDRLSPVSGRA